MGTRRVSTGTAACRTTFSATLPMRKCARPVRPDVAITMLSAPTSGVDDALGGVADLDPHA